MSRSMSLYSFTFSSDEFLYVIGNKISALHVHALNKVLLILVNFKNCTVFNMTHGVSKYHFILTNHDNYCSGRSAGEHNDRLFSYIQ